MALEPMQFNNIDTDTVMEANVNVNANSHVELTLPLNKSGFSKYIIGGYQFSSMNPASANLVLRAERMTSNNTIYLYVYNHSSAACTFTVTVDVLCIA